MRITIFGISIPIIFVIYLIFREINRIKEEKNYKELKKEMEDNTDKYINESVKKQEETHKINSL